METDISPLAKRLAEENNVNWRSLAGSGSSGRVVERDVLEYLARVMAGEEDLNPTAEPVPEGMEAWPEEDVQGYTATATAADEPTSEDDAMFGDEPAGAMPSVSATRNEGFVDDFEDDIDEDIFLFDDDETEPPTTQDAYTETFGATPSSFEADTATSEPDEVNLDDAFSADAPVAFTNDDADEDITVTQDAVEADALEDDLFALDEPTTDVDEDVSLFVGEAVVSDEPVTFDEDMSAATVVDEPVADDESTYADDFAADTFAVEEGVEEDSSALTDADDAETALTDPTADEVDTAFAELETADEDAVEPVAVAATAAPDVTAETSLPFVSYGVLLRRRVDLGAVTGAQVAIGQELGQEPVSPTSLLLRAAAKAAREHQFAGIGLVTLGQPRER